MSLDGEAEEQEGPPAPQPPDPDCRKCRSEAGDERTKRLLVEKDQGFELETCTCAGNDVIWRKP